VGVVVSAAVDWPHSPVHRLEERGAYIVTAGTYQKAPLFHSGARLAALCQTLGQLGQQYAWALQAWAVFPNHYHFVAISPADGRSLRRLVQHLHSITAIQINRADRTPGRKVWFQYWDSLLSGEKSYFARLSYVHHNAVHHGLVKEPANYPWCSAGWFSLRANRAFFKTVTAFPHSRAKFWTIILWSLFPGSPSPAECGSLLPPALRKLAPALTPELTHRRATR
jgi:putative transposase